MIQIVAQARKYQAETLRAAEQGNNLWLACKFVAGMLDSDCMIKIVEWVSSLIVLVGHLAKKPVEFDWWDFVFGAVV